MHLLNKAKKIVVGISGGVDSAVSAYLLKKQFEIVGVFMKNWDVIDETGYCTVEKDFQDAQEVCRLLQIPLYEANFVKEYWNEVFDKLISDYKNRLTPNPDILCNRHIKFNYFIDFALNQLNANMVATGHYARSVISENFQPPGAKLLKARDSNKDQTFFLSQISQFALSKTLFPLGDLLKSQVKEIAISNGLGKFAKKRESMGICFIGPRNFQDFIAQYIVPMKGNFIDIDSGKIVGEHSGQHSWTLGQRCKISGVKRPYYIAHKNTSDEDILVAMGHNHPVLFSGSVITGVPVWVHSEPRALSLCGGLYRCQFRFQHRDPLVDCSVAKLSSGGLFISLAEPLRAITPGQHSVLYTTNECLGSAQILHPGPSEFTLNSRT